MPIVLLLVIMGFCAIAAIAAVCLQDLEEDIITGVIVFFVAAGLFVGGVVWMNCAWNQDMAYEEYYSVATVKMPNGSEINAIMLKNSTDLKNVNSMFGQIIPSNSLVRVYYYGKYKSGLNWQNDEIPHYELIVPGNPNYENALKKVEKPFQVKENK